jgi:tRNA(adenine34) deaminase
VWIKREQKHFLLTIWLWVLAFLLIAGGTYRRVCADDAALKAAVELDELEKRVSALIPDPRLPDDFFILATLQEAVAAKREGSGGVGACLVQESTGKIVMRGHNHQFMPHFRSDMHAEMDLMNRYEDSVQITRIPGNSTFNPRRVDGLVLYSSVEPCPMCLTRIINTGLKKAYYAAADPTGGMVHKIGDLPLYWKEAAAGRTYAEANCSQAMKEIATRLFWNGRRNITK